ncbi:Glutamate--tRNA ligase 1 [bioreactor metagenome]|uniref:glutamate--tRNA ligase n=1 Tax=bioreactor metagenome TaxID=1076179 RepID=A0A644T5X0_9ZZZZ|nr:glutamate--tRNA ligase family protein [Candidatus Elulimicrobiales bacterium]
MSENNKIITRFAPSPTGFLHIGGARSALFNYIFTKQKEGKIILRIEDTDLERNKEEFTEGIYRAFEWLDLKFDENKKQSDNFPIHRKYLEKLISEGHAYISKTKEEDLLEAKKEGKTLRGEVIRFKNPNKVISFTDLIRGEVSVDTTDLGDFVIAKSLDEPVFHLSNVVDDILMGVTHIIRGEEHLANTPRQILIWEAVGERERATYAHIPLILSETREKLSKRIHGEIVSVEYYKNRGYLKDAFINFLAFLGWNPGGEREIYSLGEIIKEFNIEKVQKGGAVFNIEKLNWFNKEYIKLQSESEQLEYIKEFLPNIEKYSDEMLQKLRPVLVDRISYYAELKDMDEVGELDYYLNTPTYSNPNEIIWKKSNKENTILNLELIENILRKENNESNLDNLWEEIYKLAEEKGKGDILWPLRYALSGKDKSPDPKSLLYILDTKEALLRVENAIESLRNL